MTSNSPTHDTTCWINGRCCPPEEASLSIFDHGILYGDGVFEGIRFYNRTPLLLEAHLTRLAESARHISIDIPYSSKQLTSIIYDLCQKPRFASGYLRLVVTRGQGPMGLNPIGCGPANVFIILAELNMMPNTNDEHGIHAIIAQTQRIPPAAIDPHIKSLNYLNNILAKQEANNAGADEAIMLNQHGNVAEAVAENVFITKNGALITPPCSDGALNGITRQTIISLATNAHIPTVIQSVSKSDLLNADEVFLTGTGAELIPVKSINKISVRSCPGPIFSELNTQFRRFISDKTTKEIVVE